MEEIINVPNYIDGRFIYNEQSKIVLYDFNRKPAVENHLASHWMQQAAIETATFTQRQLAQIPINKIIRTIEKAMDYFFDSDEKYKIVVRLSGSPFAFVKGGIEYLKVWAKNLHLHWEKVLGTNPAIMYRQTAPVVATIPSNSEEESLYVFAQTLMSRNALIVRPSSKSASAYAAIEFVRALNKAIDQLNDPEIEPLRNAISIVNTSRETAISNFHIDGWNYILFGDDNTLKKIKQEILAKGANPRNIIAYGTGLCSTIVLNDAEINKHIKQISESISVNVGNECISTDVIYVHSDVYSEFVKMLGEEINALRSGDPFDDGSIGLVNPSNHEFIERELKHRGRVHHLIREDNKLHTSIVHTHKFDSVMEYPGPVVSIRMFNDMDELHQMMLKDLEDNGKKKNLVCSVYTESRQRYEDALKIINAYKIRHNFPTHSFDPLLPHQGIHLLQELVEPIYLDPIKLKDGERL